MICDRCSRFGKGEALGAIALNPVLKAKGDDKITETFEICPFCVAEFVEWMAVGKDKGAGEPPFTAPYKPDGDGSPDGAGDGKKTPLIQRTLTAK